MSRSTATTGPEPAGAVLRQRSGYLCAALVVGALGLAGPWALDRAIRHALDALRVPAGSTVVLDRDGRLLRPFATREGRWSLPVATHDVDSRFTALLLATEDGRFYAHDGIDPRAALRAAAQWVARGRIVSGASTLTMQVARLMAPRPHRSLGAKLDQAIRALALERRFSKVEILEFYLRLAPYGGNLQGIRAASLAWFGHEPRSLSLAEAALLVALPQAPERRRPDRFAAKARAARDRVIDHAVALGLADPAEAEAARREPVPDGRRDLPALAFHAAGEARAADRGAPSIRLALDAGLQAGLEPLVRRHAERFGLAVSGALIVIDNATGEVLAHIGAADPRSVARAGAIDMARAYRSPGSALKPFIYALAFENGIAAPDTVIEDRPTHYGAYGPVNFDQDFQGSVTARRALQISLNLPAVALLDQVGPVRFLARLGEAGVAIALPRGAAPGLAIGLGGLGIRLVDLARLYAGLARGGDVPVLVERLGGLDTRAAPSRGRPVADPVSAWSVTDILRGAAPPPNRLGGRIGFKTGTSYGYRDALAAGSSRRYTVAAWLGRPDDGAVPGLVGRQAAAPLLFDAFALLPGTVETIPMPSSLHGTAATVPLPLRRLRGRDGGAGPPLRIAFPPDGATVDVGLDRGSRGRAAAAADLALKVEGGAPPFTWFINGLPAGAASPRRQARWTPDGAGFARISVIDAGGQAADAAVRLR